MIRQSSVKNFLVTIQPGLDKPKPLPYNTPTMTPLPTMNDKCACGGTRRISFPYNLISESSDWEWYCEACGESQSMSDLEVKTAINILLEEIHN